MYVVTFYNFYETHCNLSFLDNELDGNKKLPNIQCLLASILKYLITWNVSRTSDLVKLE